MTSAQPTVHEAWAAVMGDVQAVRKAGSEVIGPGGEVVPWASVSDPCRYVTVTIPAAVKAAAITQIAERLPAVLAAAQPTQQLEEH